MNTTGSTDIGVEPLTASGKKPLLRLFALIIGINKYDSVNHLYGAVPDANAVQDYLQNDLGVPSSQIRNLRDSEATRVGITGEIETFLINNDNIKKGDPILIYYAGHGGWKKAPTGWQTGGTGNIQLLIPCDYSDRPEAGDRQHGIPDRTFGALVSRLANKQGDNITVILDSCHSTSALREDNDPTQLVRGGFEVRDVHSDLDRHIWGDLETLKDLGRGTKVPASSLYGGLRSSVLLAACGEKESALERNDRGLFTQALLDALKKFGIDKLTYTSLLKRMSPLTQQNPQCEGVNQGRILFTTQLPGKRTVYYNICGKEGSGKYIFLMDAGAAHGITSGAKFEVQDQDSGELLGTVVARKPEHFSTIMDYAEGSEKFTLKKDGFARQISVGTEEHVRIHVATDIGVLKDLARDLVSIDPTIRLVEQEQEADFGIALENGKVVFNIVNPEVKKHGLTRMPYIQVEPTLDAIYPIVRAGAHFYWHLRRTGGTLARKIEFEISELAPGPGPANNINDDLQLDFHPISWKSEKPFNLQIEESAMYAWKVTNDWNVALYSSLFYFDNSDWSITSIYEPGTAGGSNVVDPPLPKQNFFTIGYGPAGSVPHTFFLPEGQELDVGFLKLFLSTKQVDLSHLLQLSPFEIESLSEGDVQGREGRAVKKVAVPTGPTPLWDTVRVPVIQRRADN